MSTLVLVACGSGAQITAADSPSTAVPAKPKEIVFLNYAIKKDKDNKKTVTFLNAKKVKGVLKRQHQHSNNAIHLEDLVCQQRDANFNVIDHLTISNPLERHIEYIDDTKTFKAAQIALDSSVFSVRLQLHPKTTHITIQSQAKSHTLASTNVLKL